VAWRFKIVFPGVFQMTPPYTHKKREIFFVYVYFEKEKPRVDQRMKINMLTLSSLSLSLTRYCRSSVKQFMICLSKKKDFFFLLVLPFWQLLKYTRMNTHMK
jgi:hypothetical protein